MKAVSVSLILKIDSVKVRARIIHKRTLSAKEVYVFKARTGNVRAVKRSALKPHVSQYGAEYLRTVVFKGKANFTNRRALKVRSADPRSDQINSVEQRSLKMHSDERGALQ